MAALSVAVLAVAGLAAPAILVAGPAQADTSTGTGGLFVPVQGRILDTRASSSVGGYSTPMPANSWRTVQVTGVAGVPTTGVAAVAVNFSVLNNASGGNLRADEDEATPNQTVTYMFWVAGQPQSNSGVVAVADDGKIQVKSNTATDLLIDVQGYYTAGDPAAGGYVPLAETRLVDTRNGTGLPQAPLAAGSTTTIPVAGLAGVPADASAVMVDFLVENQTSQGNLIPYPADQPRPLQALHFDDATPDPTSAAVALSSSGSPTGAIDVRLNMSGTTGTSDLVIDVLGYFTADATGGAFTPAATRVYDTRTAGNTPLAGGETRTIPVAGVAGVPATGIGTALVNISIFNGTGTAGGWTHAWPSGAPEPNPSMAVQYTAGGNAANLLPIAVGTDGAIKIHNLGQGPIDTAIDIEGWYSQPLDPPLFAASSVPDGTYEAAAVAGGQPASYEVVSTDPYVTEIAYSFDGAPYTSVSGTDINLSFDISSTPATHRLTVYATNGSGLRSASQTSTFYVADPPGAPDSVTVATTGGGSALLTWSQGTNTGPAVDSYDVRYEDQSQGRSGDLGFCDGCKSQVITDLVAGDTYVFSVAAHNAAGTGPTSNSTAIAIASAGSTPTCAAPPPGCGSMSADVVEVAFYQFNDGSGQTQNEDTGAVRVLSASDGSGGEEAELENLDTSYNTAGDLSGPEPSSPDDYVGDATGVNADGVTVYSSGELDTPDGYKLWPGQRTNEYIWYTDQIDFGIAQCKTEWLVFNDCHDVDKVTVSVKEWISGDSSHTFRLIWTTQYLFGNVAYELGATYGCGVNIHGNDHQCYIPGDNTSGDPQVTNAILHGYSVTASYSVPRRFDFGTSDVLKIKFPYTDVRVRYQGRRYWLDEKVRMYDFAKGGVCPKKRYRADYSLCKESGTGN